ncbi:mannosyl-3-phosphoglycerate phosphatase [Marinobacter daqiaonensis]|uniref:Mannosyl-3-phosphoglycerate phosphatase n=1 Tax=Marinobacter daqiaonensis TaxID=650891 RepID=A0A1I6JDZ8_9GAMM|nr:HAD-IIB family hydrolase [Marinobacter daqiaonensis]SFR77218.1 mannosyl-3-phosphoglycerate phosphatase [Marinobacter daqiaonensis]
MPRPGLIFFSDLDGTLLDHHSYDWTPAAPALERLRRHRLPLVLNSSKTAPEIRALRRELGNEDPFIVENGAAVVIPADYFEPGPEQTLNMDCSRSRVLAVLRELRLQGFSFTGFSDLSVTELSRVTGLDEAGAALALDRSGTEPLMWQGTGRDLETFRAALAEAGLNLVEGGRFLHVMGLFDKADGMRYLMSLYARARPGPTLLSIALGDSPNDLPMLAGADLAVVISGVNSDAVELPDGHAVMRSVELGPAGWNQCVQDILSRYDYD